MEWGDLTEGGYFPKFDHVKCIHFNPLTNEYCITYVSGFKVFSNGFERYFIKIKRTWQNFRSCAINLIYYLVPER